MFLSMYQLIPVWFLLQRVVAQRIQDNWIAPIGADSDFQQTFINGQVLAVAWEGWNASVVQQYLEETTTVADLWVTSFNFALSPFSQLLIENINIVGPGSYSWTINIDAKDLSASAEYILRFTTPGKNYDDIYVDTYVGVSHIPSPAFIILPGTTTSSSSSSAPPISTSSTQSVPVSNSSPSSSSTANTAESSKSSTSTIATSTSSSTSATTSTLTSTSTIATSTLTSTSAIATSTSGSALDITSTSTTNATTGLKTSAIAGIAVGSAIGGIAATVLLVLAFRRYWRSTPQSSLIRESKDYYALSPRPCTPPLTELATTLPEFATSSNTSELPALYNTR
ncbi:hypothetical protein OIDMADRAFT_21126 [Oidiodendron maius Zn]|uniref:Mid2 domain-containing protein n=1 Tax=Oidiodendron maius (strain Zn) TaxID=913774 RepID=A0A0C3GGR7_OIDMZ|nr:hypothetical protein OIDMADRAFT_21126 [Oidiodendron maius Zn]